MHNDAVDAKAADDVDRWAAYITSLRASGQFDGGSAMGAGERVQQQQLTQPASTAVTGFLRVRATSLADVRRFLIGNPVYEAGGTIEIRELPRD